MADLLTDIPVLMIRADLKNIPKIPFPDGFGIRALQQNEGELWTAVQRDAEKLFPIADDLFARQFGDDPAGIAQRCFFVTNPANDAVGTVSAWHAGEGMGPDWGRIHWVAVRPAYQGRGLGKAALSHALNQLARWHERAYLKTSTARLPAVKLYLDFGFVPDLAAPGAPAAWRDVAARLTHPALAQLHA